MAKIERVITIKLYIMSESGFVFCDRRQSRSVLRAVVVEFIFNENRFFFSSYFHSIINAYFIYDIFRRFKFYFLYAKSFYPYVRGAFRANKQVDPLR